MGSEDVYGSNRESTRNEYDGHQLEAVTTMVKQIAKELLVSRAPKKSRATSSPRMSGAASLASEPVSRERASKQPRREEPEESLPLSTSNLQAHTASLRSGPLLERTEWREQTRETYSGSHQTNKATFDAAEAERFYELRLRQLERKQQEELDRQRESHEREREKLISEVSAAARSFSAHLANSTAVVQKVFLEHHKPVQHLTQEREEAIRIARAADHSEVAAQKEAVDRLQAEEKRASERAQHRESRLADEAVEWVG